MSFIETDRRAFAALPLYVSRLLSRHPFNLARDAGAGDNRPPRRPVSRHFCTAGRPRAERREGNVAAAAIRVTFSSAVSRLLERARESERKTEREKQRETQRRGANVWGIIDHIEKKNQISYRSRRFIDKRINLHVVEALSNSRSGTCLGFRKIPAWRLTVNKTKHRVYSRRSSYARSGATLAISLGRKKSAGIPELSRGGISVTYSRHATAGRAISPHR